MKRILILIVVLLAAQVVLAQQIAPRPDQPRYCPAPNTYALPDGSRVYTFGDRVYPEFENPPDFVQGVTVLHLFTCDGIHTPQVIYFVKFPLQKYLWLRPTQFQLTAGPQRSITPPRYK